MKKIKGSYTWALDSMCVKWEFLQEEKECKMEIPSGGERGFGGQLWAHLPCVSGATAAGLFAVQEGVGMWSARSYLLLCVF